MPVQVLAGAVVAHRGPGVGVPRGDLHIPQVDAGIEITNVCLSMCGCIRGSRTPATAAR